jgi:hypothetical protein
MRLGFALERRRALKGRLPVGTSLFAVARRPLLSGNGTAAWSE